MYGPPVTLRCTRCGTFVAAPAPPSPWAAWYRCPQCGGPVAVIRPRDPAPLFSWEVFPHLYPVVPDLRRQQARAHLIAVVLLLVATSLVLVTAGGLAWQGARADPGPTYTIAGHVQTSDNGNTSSPPIVGALVLLTGENGYRSSEDTGLTGAFDFTGVPTGAFTINVTATGYEPLTENLFASPPYSSEVGDFANLTIFLAPGSPHTGTTIIDSEFPSLENFLATVWSGTSLLGVAGIAGGLGTWALVRRARAPWGIAAGSAGLLAPVALIELGVNGLFPYLTDLSAIGGVLGGVAATILLVGLLRTEAPEPPG
jgi:Carboxypeptidase regulatory-like domain